MRSKKAISESGTSENLCIHTIDHVYVVSWLTENGWEIVPVSVEEEFLRRFVVGNVAELFGVVEGGASGQSAQTGVGQPHQTAPANPKPVPAHVQTQDLVQIQVLGFGEIRSEFAVFVLNRETRCKIQVLWV